MAPRAGLVPLIVVILTGVVLSFLAIVVADLVAYYNTPEGAELGWPSATSFVMAHLFDPSVLGSLRLGQLGRCSACSRYWAPSAPSAGSSPPAAS